MTDLAKRLDQIVRGVAVILDNEQAHGAAIRLRLSRSASGTLPVCIRIEGHRSHQF
jgi:hypothetical protein